MTKINEPNFSIDLPGEWSPGNAADPAELLYLSEKGDARLVVTLLAVKPLFAIADQQRLLDDYMTHRGNYELGQVPSLKQSKAISAQTSDLLVGGWAAVDTDTGRYRQHHTVLAGSLLADFMYEADGDDEWQFAAMVDQIFGSIRVVAPETAD